MTPVDRAILERLLNDGNEELVLTPALIADNTDYARPTVREHMAVLQEMDLVEYYDEDRAVYQLSEKGRKYILGQIPVEELEEEK